MSRVEELTDQVLQPEVIRDAMKLLLTPETLRTLDNLPSLLKILEKVSKEETVTALKKLLDIVVRLDKLGILDLVRDIISDKETMESISKLILSPGFLKLLDNIDRVDELLLKVNYSSLEKLDKPINSFLEGLTSKPKPVGLIGLLGALSDSDVQIGLGALINSLKGLGKSIKGELKNP